MGVLHFENWQTPPIPLTSVLLTDDNIYDVARWMGAGKVEITEVIGKPKLIRFFSERVGDNVKASERWQHIAHVSVGNYVMRKAEHYNEWADKVETIFFDVARADIYKYQPQPKNVVNIGAAPYDR